ncbi:uncharacterized protein LOC142228877 [Haematobia irritans]|uniref:uncharacterized protein LOC142228877 n=1 Tax=Haematobia irritans TaxID=7368 RepID=UPI003F4FDB65
MNTQFLVTFSIAFLAYGWSCDPQSDNKPNCNYRNLQKPIRNFWDPTVFWICSEANAEAELVKCPDGHLFDSTTRECVVSTKWIWTNPCVISKCNPESNNEPICSERNLNEGIRNFWDPTVYWMCISAYDDAELFQCADSYMFDSLRKQCVPENTWVWTKPCPEN